MKKINVKGVIVPNSDAWIYDLFGIDCTCPASVVDALAEADGDDVEVEINSGGGEVFSGSEIYTALASYAGDVTIKIVGLAASAASVIAMAGHSIMSPTAQMMIHNVSMSAAGDYREHDHASYELKTANRAIAAAYVAKTGMTEKDVLKMMDRESWFTAEDALELGLIDEIMQPEQSKGRVQLVASSYGYTLPPALIDEYQQRKIKLQARLDDLKSKEI